MRATDLAAQAGISYRSLDHWCRRGYIAPIPGTGIGHGYSREFSDDEAAVVITAGRLTAAGLRPDAALRTARALHRDGHADLAGWRLVPP